MDMCTKNGHLTKTVMNGARMNVSPQQFQKLHDKVVDDRTGLYKEDFVENARTLQMTQLVDSHTSDELLMRGNRSSRSIGPVDLCFASSTCVSLSPKSTWLTRINCRKSNEMPKPQHLPI